MGNSQINKSIIDLGIGLIEKYPWNTKTNTLVSHSTNKFVMK